MAHAFDACLLHSESAIDSFREAIAAAGFNPVSFDRKLHVVPHGNYDGCYTPARSREEQRARMGIGNDETLFAALGQIRPYKNTVELARVFRSFAPSSGRLGIWGKPLNAEIEEALRSAIAGDSRVHYAPGFLPDEELAAAIEASDVVVLPYREFLTSGAAVLAMTFGKPVIAPDRGCFREMLAPHGNPLYDDSSPSGLSDAILACCRDRARLDAIGCANRLAADELSWKSIAAKVRSIYDAVLESRSGVHTT
jgi:glycosyltransferase involved in cell wall biosynthesis